MAKRIGPLLLAAALALTGCASLLERTYSVVEPYADSYWDTEEDSLRAESYQELVNSLLMLVEQRAEEGVVRFYTDDQSPYGLAADAAQEVRNETALGSYLVESLTFLYQGAEDHCTLTWTIAYREEAEDPDSLMTLSDAQSLVDLLRLAVREGHETLTARFSYDIPRQEAADAVERLWRELCASAAQDPGESGTETVSPEAEGQEDGETQAPEETESQDLPQETDMTGGEAVPQEGEVPPEEPPSQVEPEVQYPPCPWEIRFYPDREAVEIVEILLTDAPAASPAGPEAAVR